MENTTSDYRGTDSPNRRDNRTAIFIVIIALLLASNIYIYWKLNQKEKQNVVQTERLNVDSMRVVDLDAKYNAALHDLESMKGQNTKLDSLLNAKEAEITTMKKNLDAARKANKISDAEYKKQIAGLQRLVDDLKGQIADLEKQNNILVTQKDSLGRELTTRIDENGRITEQNKVLTKKATIGALLRPSNLNATGVFAANPIIGKKGKEKETDKARKAEKIRVCWDVPENKAADAGTKTFMVRIVSPEGVTYSMGNQGSGTFTLADTGDQMNYTTKTDIDYKQASQNVCTYWSGAAGGFSKGKYTVEVYQDGYKIGSKDFTMK